MQYLKHLTAMMLLLTSSVTNAALIEVWQHDSDLASLAAADALIAGGAADYSENRSTINYSDGQNPGSGTHFSGDVLFPGDPKSNFAVRVTGSFGATPGIEADFRLRHDDGARMVINGAVVEFPGPTNDTDSFLNDLVLQAVNTIEIVFFERSGGAHLELSARASNPNTDWWLLRVGDPTSVPEPGSLSLLALGLIALGLSRRNQA